MNIEKLIKSAEHCNLGACADCPSYGRTCCKEKVMGELAQEVKRLQDKNGELQIKLEAVKAERDAAVEDMRGICYLCKKAKPANIGFGTLMTCAHKKPVSNQLPKCLHFEWRGIQKED